MCVGRWDGLIYHNLKYLAMWCDMSEIDASSLKFDFIIILSE